MSEIFQFSDRVLVRGRLSPHVRRVRRRLGGERGGLHHGLVAKPGGIFENRKECARFDTKSVKMFVSTGLFEKGSRLFPGAEA